VSPALFTAIKDTSIVPGYNHSVAELASAALITGVFGFMWGAVAGAWSTIFAANQMAGQAFKMKLAELKEFCRVKNLDWSTRAKLTAYYEHLYPQRVIVDDMAIINDLPPSMRVELVKQIYGAIIVSVPLFFGLDSTVLTELCLALMPIPAMKGEIVAAEGTKGNEMYCIAEGTARVTSRIHATEDEERVRIFIEEVFGANGEVINLYEPSQKRMFTKVMRRAKQLALENKARVIAKGNPPARRADGGEVVSYRLLIEDEKVQAAAESTRALVTATQSINSVLEIAKKHGCVQYSGALRITAAAPHGPEIAVMPKDTWPKIHWNSSLYLLCAALRDGVTICRLLNFFLGNTLLPFSTGAGMIGQTVALATNVTGAVVGVTSHVAMTATGKAASVIPESLGGKELQQGVATANDKKEAALGKVFDSSGNASSSPRAQDGLGDAGARKNVELFVDALQDPDQEFNTGDLVVPAIHAGGDAGQHIFAVDDLVEFDRGTPQEQFEKQKRVLNCLVELGLTVSNLPG
jgi:hypothetical protein